MRVLPAWAVRVQLLPLSFPLTCARGIFTNLAMPSADVDAARQLFARSAASARYHYWSIGRVLSSERVTYFGGQ